MTTPSKIKDTITEPPKYALDLLPNKGLMFDIRMIGRGKWPNDITLPGQINLDITNTLYELIGDDSFFPCNQALRSLYSLTGVIAFNISFYNLRNAGIEGLHIDKDKTFFTVGLENKNRDEIHNSRNVKDIIAYWVQKYAIQIAGALGLKLNLTTSILSIYPKKQFGKIVRIRRPQSILSIQNPRLTEDEIQKIRHISEHIYDSSSKAASKHGINFGPNFSQNILSYINDEITNAYTDLLKVKTFFKKREFNFFERSLTPYLQSLISTVSRENNGTVHSTYHGVCQTASEPDVATMANASIFWGVSEAFTDDALELSQKIPAKIRTYEVKNLQQEDHYKQFIKPDMAKDKISTVGIMGRHIVMRYSAFNSLEFCAYMHHEKEVANCLVQNGYDVVYKAHPECDWRYFDKFFDPRISINWAPFESIIEDFDALYYHFGASSTVPHALGSNLHIFMLQDKWHDTRIWPTRIQKFYEEYCNMIPGKLGNNGLLEIDESSIIRAFQNPVSFNKEQRVKDFFCKRYL